MWNELVLLQNQTKKWPGKPAIFYGDFLSVIVRPSCNPGSRRSESAADRHPLMGAKPFYLILDTKLFTL
tara:strand:+ start:3574 stop:3780 length:207 start_codon:yes stop_codon:yes gene_type:complete